MTGSPPKRGTYETADLPEEGGSKPPTYQDVAGSSGSACQPPAHKDPQIPADEGSGSTPSTYQE